MKNHLMYFIALLFLVLGCKKEQNRGVISENHKKGLQYTYHNGGEQYAVRVDAPPKRAVLFQSYITELFLEMGLKDRIIMGTTEGNLLPKYRKDYESLPYKNVGHHANLNKEEFLLMKPDFVSGFPSDIKAETTGEPVELISVGIYPYFPESITMPEATMNDVFKDFELVGRIFGIEEKMNTFISKQKEELGQLKLKSSLEGREKIKVMVCWFSAMDNGIWVYSSLVSDLIEKANGINIFSDVQSHYDFVSFESVLSRNPDVIFMVDFVSKGESTQQKIQILKNNTILKNLNAVKNNRLYGVDLEEIYPSVRNVQLIKRMNQVLYP